MLQSEVARKFAAPKKRSSLDWLTLFMPRFAWGAALLVGLGLAASLMLPRQSAPKTEMFFAKNEAAPSVELAKEAKAPGAAPSQPVAPAETPALARTDDTLRAKTARAATEVAQADREKDSLNYERRKVDAQKEQSLAANAPAAEPTAAVGGSLAVAKQKQELASAPATAATAPTTPPPDDNMLRRYGMAPSAQAPSSSAAVAHSASAQSRDQAANTELAYKSLPQPANSPASESRVQLKTALALDDAKRRPAPIARASQKYVQFVPSKKKGESELADKAAIAKPILASFQFEQIGREVRIIDSDGSVYSGSFQSPQSFSYLDSSTTQRAAAARSLQSAAAQSEPNGALYSSRFQTDLGYFFTVSGTNQSLNQKIVFAGQILASTNATTLADQAAPANGNQVASPELNPLPLLNSRISGKAVIGTNKEVEVNAVPPH
jgi:hypothetical protein